MKIVGLTGGIGSGKTTIAGFFRELGVAVYIADDEAKKLTQHSKVIRKKIIALLGNEAYPNGILDRAFVAKRIFEDPKLLQKVNDIIHPKVRHHFKRWLLKQEGPYCIKEAAILMENGGYKECDYTILVTAPKEIRIQRILKREPTTTEAIESRMQHQWEDSEKMPLADFVIENVHLEDSKKKVHEIHKLLTKA
ncbi:MAG TPA: dephospho-CoA kinase [Flavobacteriaceae bacterium]|nr:dephospho-CoA kinase [Flavobacteriaceae bacterium]MCB9213702.1 dephospho-CoA kinase [Alteromonas sp.]HPF11926.1 dephospho-CoA kinase [Flavobacteriaceae bacterium]HQU21920.1 dephospho-CoA kinase [Flavobacteriaceae bacterium]HQU65442.1 dephospho-CoA kinase [Flavobacteriaceae bacterium]